jgi:hypothetical protein
MIKENIADFDKQDAILFVTLEDKDIVPFISNGK